MFKGVCPVINVPFNENGSVDFVGIESVIDYTLDQGCESICLFAFNSEPHKMTTDEKKEVIHYFLKSVNHRAQTLIGLIENSIAGVIELGITAKNSGADGVILYPPALATPSGKGLINYFKIISEAVQLPVMIQDNPRSTGVQMSTEFLVEAYKEIEQFQYLKVECPIPTRKMKEIIRLTNRKLKCYSGNGGIHAVDAFLSGAWGIMPGVVLSGHFVKLYNHLSCAQLDKARNIFEKLLPFAWYEDQSLEFYISCEKAILKRLGVIKGNYTRQPSCALSEDEYEELFALYDRMIRE